jgi:predicted permease
MLPWIPVLLFAGWALERSRRAPRVPRFLSAWALNVALPATVLKVLAGLPLVAVWDPAALLPWLLLGPGLLAAWLLGRWFKLPDDVRLLLLVLIPLGNTSFLGLPLLAAVRGPDALHPALLYDQFGSFPQLLLLGTLVLERGRGQGRRQVLRRLLTFPPLPTLILALSPWGLPVREFLAPILPALSWTLVPAVMLALGARLRLSMEPGDAPALVAGLLGKMLVLPLVGWILLALLGWKGPHAQVALLESAMPPMATAAAWAADRGLRPALAAALVSVGILVALAWIPLLAKLLVWLS